jgi:hypothetical protein
MTCIPPLLGQGCRVVRAFESASLLAELQPVLLGRPDGVVELLPAAFGQHSPGAAETVSALDSLGQLLFDCSTHRGHSKGTCRVVDDGLQLAQLSQQRGHLGQRSRHLGGGLLHVRGSSRPSGRDYSLGDLDGLCVRDCRGRRSPDETQLGSAGP